MKKIYLEKQFMKATNLNNYIIGEIVAHSKESGEYQIKKEDGSIMTVFSHSILGWEEYKEDSEVGYRFHYHAKMVKEKEMFICDIYKNGDFFYRYTYGFDECSVLNTSDSFRYFLLEQGNGVQLEFDDSWNELKKKKKETSVRAFTSEKLDKLAHPHDSVSKGQRVKTIYTIDTHRHTDGKNIFGFTKSTVLADGVVVVDTANTLRGNYRNVAETIINVININTKSDYEAELRVNALGLGKGLLDYLEDCPIPVKLYWMKDVRASQLALLERVEGEKLYIDVKLKEVLENLDLQLDLNGQHSTTHLKLHEQNDEHHVLLDSLILACYEGGTFFCKDKFDIYIKHSAIILKGESIEQKEDTYTLILKNNETGEEVNMTSSSNLQEVEKMKHILAHSFQMAGVQFKIKE